MRKVFMLQTPSQARKKPNAGIPQMVLNLEKHLPRYGYELVESADNADLIVSNAGAMAGYGLTCDVAHCHGLYPTGEVPNSPNAHEEINKRVIYDIRHAYRVTVPSEWVGDILRRDMHIDPDVIGWGVNFNEWQGGHNHGYVLWNKNRASSVCDPSIMNRLAEQLPDIRFVSTFGNATENVDVIGETPFEDMKQWVKHAGVYLATTKETFGIGTLEALAAGVPVLGLNHGATPDIVKHGVNGFIAESEDDLPAGIQYILQHRDILSHNAREMAKLYTWDKVACEFAAIYDAVIEEKNRQKTVSVIIPNYNYARYLPNAIESALNQETTVEYEVIVIDDYSTDNSLDVAQRYQDDVTLIFKHKNTGVAHTRNSAIEAANGDYIVCLDADDMMAPTFIQTCFDAIDSDRSLGIVFTGLQVMGDDTPSQWPNGYDFSQQMIGRNQIPSLCMFRKSAWEQAGGYRDRYTPSEDAALWLQIGALGYDAKQVTREPLFLYRWHNESLSSHVRQGIQPAPNWIDRTWITNAWPCGIGGPVYNYDNPVISVIIPVGPSHVERLQNAIDSVENQTFKHWELIVVNDSGDHIDLSYAPYAKLYHTSGKRGASVARNIGLNNFNGDFVIFLDADDIILPDFMEKTLALYRQSGRYVYTDWVMKTQQGTIEEHNAPNFQPNLIFERGYFHPITTLIPRHMVEEIRFDTDMKTWEDWDFYAQLISSGFCGIRLPQKIFYYDYNSGTLRRSGFDKVDQIKEFLTNRYHKFIVEGEQVSCCGSKKVKKQDIQDEMVMVEYMTERQGKHTLIGSVSRTHYGRRQRGDKFYIYSQDYDDDLFQAIIYEEQPKRPTETPPIPTHIR